MNSTEEQTDVKTIDINCLEWFDKVNGNSYFAGAVTVNYGTKQAQEFPIPFQYGYGDQYKHEAFEVLEQNGLISREKYANGSKEPMHQFCSRNGIVTRAHLQTGCKKRDLK